MYTFKKHILWSKNILATMNNLCIRYCSSIAKLNKLKSAHTGINKLIKSLIFLLNGFNPFIACWTSTLQFAFLHFLLSSILRNQNNQPLEILNSSILFYCQFMSSEKFKRDFFYISQSYFTHGVWLVQPLCDLSYNFISQNIQCCVWVYTLHDTKEKCM